MNQAANEPAFHPCDACETLAWCSGHGCIPITRDEVPQDVQDAIADLCGVEVQ